MQYRMTFFTSWIRCVSQQDHLVFLSRMPLLILWRHFWCAKYSVAFAEVLLLAFHAETIGRLHLKMFTLLPKQICQQEDWVVQAFSITLQGLVIHLHGFHRWFTDHSMETWLHICGSMQIFQDDSFHTMQQNYCCIYNYSTFLPVYLEPFWITIDHHFRLWIQISQSLLEIFGKLLGRQLLFSTPF